MARDPRVPRQRTPQKQDIVKLSPAHKRGTRHEDGRRAVPRNTPAFGKRGAKRRAG
jgi:hypothetical protein